MDYQIERVDESNKNAMLKFLKKNENYTLFLLGNFENYGLKLSFAPYSGNYKLIRSHDQVLGVFSLTKKGSLLIETSEKAPVFEAILKSCQEESIPITGLVGNWEFCHLFWNFLKSKTVIQSETFNSKEILYSVDLTNFSGLPQPHVRVLTEADYVDWKPLRLDYLVEEGVPNDLTNEQLSNMYHDKVEKKIIWGYFLEGKLVSVADLNAKALDLGQVGGVYTIPSFRRKGYSKSVMQQLLLDAKTEHSISKLIIFTGEKNIAAQKVYNALGVEHVGYFSLLFGK